MSVGGLGANAVVGCVRLSKQVMRTGKSTLVWLSKRVVRTL